MPRIKTERVREARVRLRGGPPSSVFIRGTTEVAPVLDKGFDDGAVHGN